MYAKLSPRPRNIMSTNMGTESLELVSTAAVEKLRSLDFSGGKMDVYHAYSGLTKAIAAYESRNWSQSAELFIQVWRDCELAVSNHLEREISMYIRQLHSGCYTYSS
jgi:hypothetical protein